MFNVTLAQMEQRMIEEAMMEEVERFDRENEQQAKTSKSETTTTTSKTQ